MNENSFQNYSFQLSWCIKGCLTVRQKNCSLCVFFLNRESFWPSTPLGPLIHLFFRRRPRPRLPPRSVRPQQHGKKSSLLHSVAFEKRVLYLHNYIEVTSFMRHSRPVHSAILLAPIVSHHTSIVYCYQFPFLRPRPHLDRSAMTFLFISIILCICEGYCLCCRF